MRGLSSPPSRAATPPTAKAARMFQEAENWARRCHDGQTRRQQQIGRSAHEPRRDHDPQDGPVRAPGGQGQVDQDEDRLARKMPKPIRMCRSQKSPLDVPVADGAGTPMSSGGGGARHRSVDRHRRPPTVERRRCGFSGRRPGFSEAGVGQAGAVGWTSDVQNEQRRAAAGISLRHSGQSRVPGFGLLAGPAPGHQGVQGPDHDEEHRRRDEQEGDQGVHEDPVLERPAVHRERTGR